MRVGFAYYFGEMMAMQAVLTAIPPRRDCGKCPQPQALTEIEKCFAK
jgi:hypothetical protein